MPQSSVISKPKCCLSHFKCILLSMLALTVGFFAGFYIGCKGSPQVSNQFTINQPIAQTTELKKGSYEDGYQSALEFARKKLAEKGMFGLFSKQGSTMLPRVEVKSVSGNTVTVEFDSSLFDIFSEGKITKTITIPDTVKIEKRTQKDPDEFQKAFDEYRKQQDEFRNNAKTPEDMKNLPQPPMSYTVENVNISDLNAGDLLNIFCQSDPAKPDTLIAQSVEFINDQNLINDIRMDLNSIPATTPVAESNSDNSEIIPLDESIPQAEQSIDTPLTSQEAPATTETTSAPIAE